MSAPPDRRTARHAAGSSVRCIDPSAGLTLGRVYRVIEHDALGWTVVHNDSGKRGGWAPWRFEPVSPAA